MPVEKNFASVYVIEAHEQVDKCGLARSGRPHYRNELTRLDFKIHIFDKRRVGGMAEADIPELDLAAGLFNARIVAVRALIGLVEQLEYALRTREGGLEVVGNIAYADKRLHEELRIGEEGRYVAERERAFQDIDAAYDADEHIGYVADKVHYRTDYTGDELCLVAGLCEADVDIVELVYRLLFVVKDLYERMSGVHLLDVSVYVARLVPLTAEIAL